MENYQLIPANVICLQHSVEYSFIYSLHTSGLIEVTIIEEEIFLHTDQLQQLEKFIRLHYDLEINLQGIEAIAHLLQQIESLQGENESLKKKLKYHENTDSEQDYELY